MLARRADHNPAAEVQATQEAPAYTVAIEKILEEREQAQARERAVIEGLNTALAKIGYKIVPFEEQLSHRKRRNGGGGRQRRPR